LQVGRTAPAPGTPVAAPGAVRSPERERGARRLERGGGGDDEGRGGGARERRTVVSVGGAFRSRAGYVGRSRERRGRGAEPPDFSGGSVSPAKARKRRVKNRASIDLGTPNQTTRLRRVCPMRKLPKPTLLGDLSLCMTRRAYARAREARIRVALREAKNPPNRMRGCVREAGRATPADAGARADQPFGFVREAVGGDLRVGEG
jgi:hypothetical protein